MTTEVIPSILVYSADELAQRLKAVGTSAPVVQLDVLDKTLIPYEDFHDADFIDGLKPEVSFEIHLMVRGAVDEIAKWNHPWVKKIIFHLEADGDPAASCRQVRDLNKLVGIALSPQTPAKSALPLVHEVDTILVMTVEPGRNGAPFLPGMLAKVRALREAVPELNLEVDGGVNLQTLKSCAAAGANLFVVGSFLKNNKFVENYQQLKQALQ